MAIEETEVAARRRLVLDANILLRGILGTKVLSLLETYEDTVAFYSPDICFDDAREYIPDLATRRGFDPSANPKARLSLITGSASDFLIIRSPVNIWLARPGLC